MARGSISDTRTQKTTKPGIEPKVIGGAVVGGLLLLVLVWVWWPSATPKIDPTIQKALEAQKNDPAANPPVADVPIQADGPRRKAVKK